MRFAWLWAGIAGAAVYPLIEICYRGGTHPSMALAGGVCAALIWMISDRAGALPLLLRIFLAAVTITAVELLFGIVCNRMLGLGVWAYSSMPYHFLGQICLPYFFLWLLLSAPVCLLFTQISDRFRS